MLLPKNTVSPVKKLNSVDSDLGVERVEEGTQKSPYCPHDYEYYQVVCMPEPFLILFIERRGTTTQCYIYPHVPCFIHS